ncbi:glycerophosphodiester phosphodiesterase domain-containing protein 5-like [Mya arenaria]|uniref:glycerophosphodiester phosphodiesterase domain-containing protein 5-like n=1 Tax=Mya arenaria TaxID=6604 RepID=UPI0022E2D19D|nr:glycerophosphodiester phosphodiesterase domain-containing protein 5-like [Mya arenaria]
MTSSVEIWTVNNTGQQVFSVSPRNSVNTPTTSYASSNDAFDINLKENNNNNNVVPVKEQKDAKKSVNQKGESFRQKLDSSESEADCGKFEEGTGENSSQRTSVSVLSVDGEVGRFRLRSVSEVSQEFDGHDRISFNEHVMARLSTERLQNYSHNYGKVCMTGLLGCRWHRYKQSTKGSTKWDVGWFMFLILAFLFAVSWFYFILIMKNDEIDFNIFMYDQTESWISWYTLLLACISMLFAYVIILMLLSLCHIGAGHQLYIHPCQLAVIFVVLIAFVVLTIVIDQLWSEEWAVVYISLQMFGPFLQIGAVVVMTLASWLISLQWFSLNSLEWKIGSLLVYAGIMCGIYVSPLFIYSPCVILAENIPKKPLIFAHRGAAALAPENTMAAFDEAYKHGAYGIEFDVRMSFDGVPYIMHDSTLKRTTDVDEVFPEYSDMDASYFNSTDLQKLNAGKWFIEHGPSSVVNGLADDEKARYNGQPIPFLEDVLTLATKRNFSIMFDVGGSLQQNPYVDKTWKIIDDVIRMKAFNKSKVYCSICLSNVDFTTTKNYKCLGQDETWTAGTMKANNISLVNLQHSQFDSDLAREYQKHGLQLAVYIVDSEWLYSYYWCAGVDMVASNYCHTLGKMSSPIWRMSPRFYLAVWVTVDVISAALIVIMFFIQRHRIFGNRFHPEQVSLSSSMTSHSNWGHRRSRRSMKEKLLMKDMPNEMFEFEPEHDADLGIDSTSYEATVNASEGQALAQSFRSNRASCHSNNEVFYSINNVDTRNRESLVSEGDNEVFLNGKNRNSFHTLENGDVTERSLKRGQFKNTGTATSTNTYQSESEMT